MTDCLAHLLNLAVKDSLKECIEIQQIMQKIHNCVTKFRNSANVLQEFRRIRKELEPENQTCELKLDVETRWNSEVHFQSS